jgi:holo-[acyl-carrier protein] synthase
LTKVFGKIIDLFRPTRVKIGSDIVWIPDIQKSVEKFGTKYLNFIFTDDEIAQSRNQYGQLSYASLAARFAAKEAMMKLLKTGNDDLLPWQSIEIKRQQNMAPRLELYSPAKEFAKMAKIKIDRLNLSFSHDRDYATAVIVALYKE